MRNQKTSKRSSAPAELRPNEWSVKLSSRPATQRTRKEWTKQEDAIVREYYPVKGSIPVAVMLGRTMTSVQSRAERLGIPGTKKWWSKKEEVFLRRNYGKLTAPEIGKRLGRTEQSVRGQINKLGLTDSTARAWTADEEAYLRKHYRKVRRKELAEELGRTAASVALKAKRMKLLRSASAHPSTAQIKWIRAHLGTFSFAEMSRRLGFSVQTIGRIAHVAGFRPRPNIRAWTATEDAYLQRHYGSKSRKQIAEALGRGIPTVQWRARKLGLTNDSRQTPRRWTRREDAVVKRWYGKKTYLEIGLLLDRTQFSVQGRAAQLGLKIRKS